MERKNPRKSLKVLKPSPNEEEAIIKNALAERRKQRLLQVRNQEKKLSGKIRNAVKDKREKELNSLKLHLQREWDIKISKEIDELEEEYKKRIETLGEGHRSIEQVSSKDATETNKLMKEKALERYTEALKKLAEQRTALRNVHEEKTKLRQKVAKAEQIRASAVASKPPPDQDVFSKIENLARQSVVSSRTRSTDFSFSNTRFHMQAIYAEKADQQPQVDAREAARDLEGRITEAKSLVEKDLNERKEKANLRHQHARQQVLLDQSKDRLLEQLEGLEFKDRVRRQQVLSKIPKQVFQPPYQRDEDAKAKQIMLEEAFENAHLPTRDIHEHQLNLDLESELEALEKDLAQDEATLHEETESQPVVVPMASEEQERFQEETLDEVPKTAGQNHEPDDAAPKTRQDPAKRMQKLLGRIRKQQDDWSKQAANRKIDGILEKEKLDQRRDESETPDSLVSADIDSARYTNSNTETIELDKERMSNEDISTETDESKHEMTKEDSLLHPFEKAKLIRSAGRKSEQIKERDQLSGVSSLDFDKRKKTLENQKYLFKIQKQRLENQMLRSDLQNTEKALGLLVDENQNYVQQEISDGSYAFTPQSSDISRADIMEKADELYKGVQDSPEFNEAFPKDVNEVSEDGKGYENVIDGNLPAKSISNEYSIGQAELSIVSGLSDAQREKLSRRYPNILKGLSVDKPNNITPQTELEALSEIENSLNKRPTDPSQDKERTPAASTSGFQDAFSKTNVVPSSKPKVEMDRIRRYQEQLLQKQKWLKSRHDILQKRHDSALKEFKTSNSRALEDSHRSNDNRDVQGIIHEDMSEENGAQKISEKNFVNFDSVEPLLDTMPNRIHGPEVVTASMDIEKTDIKDSEFNTDKGIITVDNHEPTPTQIPLKGNLPDEQSSGISNRGLSIERQTNKIQDILPDLSSIRGNEADFVMQNGFEKGEEDTCSQAISNLDDLQILLREVNSIHLQTNTTSAESSTLDSQPSDTMRKSHRLISGKPVFSPIQEVEETSFKERRNVIAATHVNGKESASSLVEQELPTSSRSASDISHFSPVRSTQSNERSEMSSAFSLRELVSSLSETDYLPLPTAMTSMPRGQPPMQRKLSPMRHLSDVAEAQKQGDIWTPLQPYYSGPKDEDNQTDEHVSHQLPSRVDSSIEFDVEKYARLLQANLSVPIVPSEDNGEKDVYQIRDAIEMGSLREGTGDLVDIGQLRLPEVPQLPSSTSRLPSLGSREQLSITSMRETGPIHIDSNSSSSSSSKGSSKNMAKYEEILERVRMLPYKHLEEYNKLSESYRSWRKKTVEPLLQPNIPDPFSGYKDFGNDELHVKEKEPSATAQSPVDAILSDIEVYHPLQVIPVYNGFADQEGSHVRSGSRDTFASRIHLHEPVRDFNLAPGGTDWNGDEEIGGWSRKGVNHEDVSRSLNIENVPHFSASTSSNERAVSQYNEIMIESNEKIEEPTDTARSSPSDQLTEQKIFEGLNTNYTFRTVDGSDFIRQDVSASDEEEGLAYDGNIKLGIVRNEIYVDSAPDYRQPSEEAIKQNISTHHEDPTRDIRDFDIEAIQRRFLEKFVSSVDESSATKSSFTNSSSSKSKGQSSTDIRSDETISELARLWSTISQSSKINEGETSTFASTTKSSSRQGSSDTSKVGSSTTTSSNNRNAEKKDDLSEGFKDPNHYDISLYKSTSHKDSKLNSNVKQSSYRSDDSYGFPSIPQFASTRLTHEGSSDVESARDLNAQSGLTESLRFNPLNETGDGHSETSWLLPSNSFKGETTTRHSDNIEERNSEGVLPTTSFHVLDSDITEKENLSKDSSSSPGVTSSHDGRSNDDDDDGVRTWNELLAAQVSGSSAKESDGELPEGLKLKKDAFIRRSQQRLQQSKKRDAKNDHTKFRVDGRVDKNSIKARDKENKMLINGRKMVKKVDSLQNGKPKTGNKPTSSGPSVKQKQTKQEILQENRRRVKQFQKKIQSSLRNRKK